MALSRIKGDIVQPNGQLTPHFGHGLGDIGLFGKVEGDLKLKRGIHLSGSAGVTGGISFSGFDNESKTNTYSQGFIKLGWLSPASEPSWSSHGAGGTAYGTLSLSFGSSAFCKKSSQSDIFKIVVGVTGALHANYISKYTHLNSGTEYGPSTIITGGKGIKVGLVLDTNWWQ